MTAQVRPDAQEKYVPSPPAFSWSPRSTWRSSKAWSRRGWRTIWAGGGATCWAGAASLTRRNAVPGQT